MSIQIANKYLFTAILVAFLALFFGGWYLGASKSKKALKSSENALNEVKFELSKTKIELDKKTIYLTRAEQEVATQKELVKAGVIEREELRKLNIKYLKELDRLNLQIDTLLANVNHNGQIIIVQQNKIDSLYNNVAKIPQKAILLPFTFDKSDNYLRLKGEFDKDGKLGINLKMDIPLTVIASVEKQTKKPVCLVTTPNSYIDVIKIESYTPPKTNPKRWGIGLSVGYGMTIEKDPRLAPVVAVGLSHNFIRF